MPFATTQPSRRHARLPAVIPFALLVACAGAGGEPPEEPDACGASRLQGLAGRHISAFDPAAVRGPMRIIPPVTAVTMDYSPVRLNVETTRRGRISRISCG